MNRLFCLGLFCVFYSIAILSSQTPTNLVKALEGANKYYKAMLAQYDTNRKWLESLTVSVECMKNAVIALDDDKTRLLSDARMLYCIAWQGVHKEQRVLCSLSDQKKDKSLYSLFVLKRYIEEMIRVTLFWRLAGETSPSGTSYIRRSFTDAASNYVSLSVDKGVVSRCGLSCDKEGRPYFNGRKIVAADGVDLSWSLRIDFNTLTNEVRVRHPDYEDYSGELHEKIMSLYNSEKPDEYVLKGEQLEKLVKKEVVAALKNDTPLKEEPAQKNRQVQCVVQ